jgi:hypothetical protein
LREALPSDTASSFAMACRVMALSPDLQFASDFFRARAREHRTGARFD